ncbi:MAG: ShlB/FhaC/HecB family hemolysin secretion/activation protein [Veillonellaceae bacterium]|nr:ShlB/FhaC/HecB family hemolysin secretion/activation protein [Veillonellaceae bacterium]
MELLKHIERIGQLGTQRKARSLAAALGILLGAACGFAPHADAASISLAQQELSRPNDAQAELFAEDRPSQRTVQAKADAAPVELFEQERKIAEQQAQASSSVGSAQAGTAAEKPGTQAGAAGGTGTQQSTAAPQGVRPDRAFVSVSSLVVDTDAAMTEAQLLRAVPEASKKIVSVHQLSRQIQFLNDGGALKVGANFSPATDGYVLTLTSRKQQESHATVTVSNTGNDYTGNWRVATSYVDRNLTHHGDTLGVAYVTSPSGGHIGDVKQAALAYRFPLPKLSDALVLTASYSDVDLGSIYSDGLYDIGASGKGTTAGLHYQHNLAYTSREKDAFDFGINYWNMKNDYDYHAGTASAADDSDYDVSTASLAFQHNDRDEHHSFSYMAGIETSLGKAGGDRDALYGYDKSFQVFKTGINYQYRTKDDWIFGGRLFGQYTRNDLLPALQIGAGGRTSVRGFAERAIAADKGLVGSLEAYTPELFPGSRFVFFVDAAHLANNHDAQLFDSANIASAGVGYRYEDNQHHMNVALDYAGILKDVPDDWNQQHKRWNMLFSWNF